MELDKFIENTILDIMNGVAGAQERCPETGVINPYITGSNAKGAAKSVIDVKFDIEIGEISEDESDGKIGVSLAMLKGGGKKTNRDTEKTTNRLSFYLPILLPDPTNQNKEEGKRGFSRDGFPIY